MNREKNRVPEIITRLQDGKRNFRRDTGSDAASSSGTDSEKKAPGSRLRMNRQQTSPAILHLQISRFGDGGTGC